jgi:hypothetical protein
MNSSSLAVIVGLCILLLSATVFLLEHHHHFHGNAATAIAVRTSRTPPTSSTSSTSSTVTSSTASTSTSTVTGGTVTAPVAAQQGPITDGKVVKLPNPAQQSKYAYVTLISGITNNFAYRGFLYNTLIMRKSLVQLGSTADFIALIGYSDEDTEPYEADMNLLRTHGVAVYVLPRLLDKSVKLTFAEMALLKVTPWSFVQYDRVQFFDGDVMPTKNMDCFFQLEHNTFTIGAVSPLNSGWFLAIPSMDSFNYLRDSAVWRLGCDWDEASGWSLPLTQFDLAVRGGKPIQVWNFNGANMDQGLLCHYFVLREGNAVLVDTDLKTARQFTNGLRFGASKSLSMGEALSVCDGNNPIGYFAHFTGRSKPWLVDKKAGGKPKPNWSVKIWMETLDSLKLPVNSTNIYEQGFNSPLGYFDINLPKKNTKCFRSEL